MPKPQLGKGDKNVRHNLMKKFYPQFLAQVIKSPSLSPPVLTLARVFSVAK